MEAIIDGHKFEIDFADGEYIFSTEYDGEKYEGRCKFPHLNGTNKKMKMFLDATRPKMWICIGAIIIDASETFSSDAMRIKLHNKF